VPEREGENINARVITEFRSNGGEVGGYFANIPLLLLTTTGAKSGRLRTSPLAYMADRGRYVIIAAAGGAPCDPAWYHNLVANPSVTVEVGADAFPATALVTTAAERSSLYEAFAALNPQVAVYQARTSRQFPVVALYRGEGRAPAS
jgi:deazaflavin-dependent oxidoreductase (nitroreductase family)